MTATPPVPVAVIGLGAIGREVVKAVRARPGLTLVGAADPAFVGRDAGEVAGIDAAGVRVRGTAAEVLVGAEIALVLTASSVSELVPIVDACAAAGVDLIPTCAHPAYAPLVTPELSRRIDDQARDAGITVVGTGVNPGLVMDRLPVTLAAACVRVDCHRGRRAWWTPPSAADPCGEGRPRG